MPSSIEDAIGKWYDEQNKKAEKLIVEIKRVEEEDPDNKELLEYLKAELEAARYVGD